jgi:hypothetical protein
VRKVTSRREPAVAANVAGPLLPAAEAGYTAGKGKRGVMRALAVIVAALALAAGAAGSADAASKKYPPQPVMRSAAGTVIEPTKTIIHDQYGHTTVIVIPRRSYLDTGTEVSVGDRKFSDYAYSPVGDPGRSTWFFGPPIAPSGGVPIPQPLYIPGFDPNQP